MPAPPLGETERAIQVIALERQIAELQVLLDSLRKPGSYAPAPSAEPNPAEPQFPTQIGGKSLQEWLKETQNPDPVVREAAARAVPGFGPDARRPAVKDMVRLVTDTDPGVRMAALGTITAMMFDTKDDQKAVFDALRHVLANSIPGTAARLYATRALTAYGSDAGLPANIDALDKIKNDPWWETRQAVANALGRIGAAVFDDPPRKDPNTGIPIPRKPPNESAMKALRQMMESDKSAAVRLEAVMGLLALGAPPYADSAEYAKMVGPNLDAVTARLTGRKPNGDKNPREEDGAVRVWLNVLLMMYDNRAIAETVPKLAEFLQDPNLVVRSHGLTAIAAIAGMNPEAAAPLLDPVRECLVAYKDHPPLVAGAISVLVALGKDVAEGAILDLEKFRAGSDNAELNKLAEEAIDVLSGKKPAPGAALPAP